MLFIIFKQSTILHIIFFVHQNMTKYPQKKDIMGNFSQLHGLPKKIYFWYISMYDRLSTQQISFLYTVRAPL